MTIMNEIVGESGEQTGEGCLLVVKIMAVSGLLSLGLMVAWSWLI